MPELPEVQALTDLLAERTQGRFLARVDVAAIPVLKTYDPPVTALSGLPVDSVQRRGKFLVVGLDGLFLVTHLARAGWLRWHDVLPTTPARPGRGPLALRVALDDGSGWDLTEAGTQKRLAVYVVRDPQQVPGISSLGVEPLTPEFTAEVFAGLLRGSRGQLKGVLRNQSLIAGVGNAYSDEILHAARLSPFKSAPTLTEGEVGRLYGALRDVLGDAVTRSHGLASGALKSDKKLNMRVHGRASQPCPVCGDTVREVSFADSALQYCPTCQTEGRLLADRRMSRLLK